MPMPQVQQYFLEGIRPEMQVNYSVPRTQIMQPPQMQRTFTIRNDVNLKKSTLALVRDAAKPSCYHLEFTFDASEECTISVFYAAKENPAAEGAMSFSPLAPGSCPPKIYAGKGLGQTFHSDSSFPLDTSQYEPSELSYSAAVMRYPLVVCLEAGGEGQRSKSAVQGQTTFANIVRPASGTSASAALTVVPLKQKIQVGSTSYELQEIYGIEGQPTSGAGVAGTAEDAPNASRECVICMTEPRDTTVLPCRHMCMCSDCAKLLRVQSNKCPICRTDIESLLQIKISKQNTKAGAPLDASVPSSSVSGLNSGQGARPLDVQERARAREP